MTDFNHKEWSRRALTVAGWADLRPNLQRGGWWMGTNPRGDRYQPAPRFTYNHTKALVACLPYNPTVSYSHEKGEWQVCLDGSQAQVKVVDCGGHPMIALARALTAALARLDGKEEQLELFGGE